MSATDGDEAGDRRLEAQRWLAIVREDIDVAVAAAGLTPPRHGAAGYHLQQAAEKILKALLVLVGEPFRHTHDLDYLVAKTAPFYPEIVDDLEQFDRFRSGRSRSAIRRLTMNRLFRPTPLKSFVWPL